MRLNTEIPNFLKFWLLLFMFAGISSDVTFSQVSSTNITYQEAIASLKTNRDRLLSTYAVQNGYANRAQVWANMSASQKGVFLTITDYLGRRSLMHFNENYEVFYYGDEDDKAFGCVAMNDAEGLGSGDIKGGSVYVHPPNYQGPSCFYVSADSCVNMGKCYVNALPRTDYDTILNHVVKIYAINGSNGNSCHGEDYNRMFFSADEELIYLIRNIELGLPTWGYSGDIFGPHSPFTQTREGVEGKPRGQLHNWAWDYEASVLTRLGVYGVYDPHIVEMDIDYTAFHASNPECYYDNVYGRTFYENYWSTRGLGNSAELNYVP